MAVHSLPATMPTTLTDFASYDEIRAVLGVSDEELEDGTLALPMYLKLLQMEFSDISGTLESQYLAAKAAPSPSAAEQKLLDVVSVFSAYAISKNLLTSMPLFAPKRITDGRAETDRVTDPFEGVREGVNSYYQMLKLRVSVALEDLGTPVTVAPSRTYFAATGLAINPVTNA